MWRRWRSGWSSWDLPRRSASAGSTLGALRTCTESRRPPIVHWSRHSRLPASWTIWRPPRLEDQHPRSRELGDLRIRGARQLALRGVRNLRWGIPCGARRAGPQPTRSPGRSDELPGLPCSGEDPGRRSGHRAVQSPGPVDARHGTAVLSVAGSVRRETQFLTGLTPGRPGVRDVYTDRVALCSPLASLTGESPKRAANDAYHAIGPGGARRRWA